MKEVENLELFIAKLLRYGVLLAGVLLGIGWLSNFHFAQDTFAVFQTYEPLPLLQNLQNLWAQQQWGLLIAFLGLGVLISLPLIRVLLTLLVFLKQGDWILAFVSGLVLFGLLLSVTLGFEI